MKTTLPIIIIFFLVSSCEKHPKIYDKKVEIYFDVFITQKVTNKDMLNPNLSDNFNFGHISLDFTTPPNQDKSISYIGFKIPELGQRDGKYYLRVTPTIYEPTEDEYKVTINWPDGGKDEISCRISHVPYIISTYEILLNGTTIWKAPNGKREITIMK
ncbi:hypothetical protein [Emticicia sp. 21SJ11W-3]|uniref:hypothetical protein n=1 Tax=Emticicia sp. 21SJ11W-3 TaxID=2916755 RepID=UPI0020A026E1|nr:hypothetical protein [Emticicia sp. 21SJ11W-3]UTA68377.1 hypothetical protein MB380_00895 [Emticicia sp. 21SJ11W-3]